MPAQDRGGKLIARHELSIKNTARWERNNRVPSRLQCRAMAFASRLTCCFALKEPHNQCNEAMQAENGTLKQYGVQGRAPQPNPRTNAPQACSSLLQERILWLRHSVRDRRRDGLNPTYHARHAV